MQCRFAADDGVIRCSATGSHTKGKRTFNLGEQILLMFFASSPLSRVDIHIFDVGRSLAKFKLAVYFGFLHLKDPHEMSLVIICS